MNDNFKFLGVISAIYNIHDIEDENYYITLALFNNVNNLKIIYKELAISSNNNDLKKGEILLKDIGEMELELITSNVDKPLIKELILAKFLDNRGDHLNFEIVY